jgi:hypothetical protein
VNETGLVILQKSLDMVPISRPQGTEASKVASSTSSPKLGHIRINSGKVFGTLPNQLKNCSDTSESSGLMERDLFIPYYNRTENNQISDNPPNLLIFFIEIIMLCPSFTRILTKIAILNGALESKSIKDSNPFRM